LSLLACTTIAASSQAAAIPVVPDFGFTMRRSKVVDHAWCCRHYRRWRWYWSPEPYNRHFDLYYGWLAAKPARPVRTHDR
jgi:hypothetical protein